jgi:integrase
MTTENNAVLSNVQSDQPRPRPTTSRENKFSRDLHSLLTRIAEFGPSTSVERFLTGYGKVGTKKVYAQLLYGYLKWVRVAKGIQMGPDELIQDNLVCVYRSDPIDTRTKRKHTDLLNEFVNVHLVGKGSLQDSRAIYATVVRRFYESNDSKLFGDFRVSSQDPVPPPPALKAEDVRTVLKSLPLNQRLPFLVIWQSSAEINRVLSLTWESFRNEYPLKLQFFGRKNHRRAYHSYVGKDAISGLKLWREKWTELQGREPRPNDLIFMGKGGPMNEAHLNDTLKRTAIALFKQGLIQNGQPKSWHSHALRHSFETEGSHAGVRSEIRNYFEGHIEGITWTYNHTDEIHPEDFEKEWLKIEPFVSLEPDKAALQNQFEERERSLVRRLEAAEALLSALKREFPESPKAQSQAVR